MIRILKFALLIAVAGGAIFSVLLIAPIPQNLGYHNFFDQRSYYGIPNFWNVVSTLPFLLVGLSGFHLLYSYPENVYLKQNRQFYALYSISLCLVAAGSTYYHLHPSDNTILWYHLPMAMLFMSFFCIVFSDYISHLLASIILYPLIVLAVASVLYWHYTESNSVDDLYFYTLLQLLPIVLIMLVLLMFDHERSHSYLIWLMLGGYVLAEICDFYDQQIFDLLNVVSGHTIKHVIAALSSYLLISRGEKVSIIKQARHRHFSEQPDRII